MAQDELCLGGEEWRDVIGFEDQYEISSFGRVRSKNRFHTNSIGRTRLIRSKARVTVKRNNGIFVSLCHNGISKEHRVDELVANAFVSIGHSDQFVLHIDCDECNLSPSNLKWVDIQTYFDECYRIKYGQHDNEEWRDVPGYEGRYQVSNFGIVKSVGRLIPHSSGNGQQRIHARPVTQLERSDGGYKVRLETNEVNVYKTVPVESIVADAFCPCSKKGMVISHINGDIGDNRAQNLTWVSQREPETAACISDSIESWLPVVGYEGLYEVSSLGNVRSLDRYVHSKNGSVAFRRGKMLSQCIEKTGYNHVLLCKNGKHTQYAVHRIVAEAFLDNPENLPQVDHINAIRNDNRVSNLRYVSMSENISARVRCNRYLTTGIDRSVQPDNREMPDLPNEEWRDISGYEGLYMVSNLGRVKSLPRRYVNSAGNLTSRPGIILKTSISDSGYLGVYMFKDGDRSFNFVHRMVAEAFLDNPNNYPIVDHINCDRTDARACNLRWCSYADNITFAIENNRVPYDIIIPKLHSEENVKRRITAVGKAVMRSDGKKYASQAEAARDLGIVNVRPIREVALGMRDEYMGYTFRYI